MSYFKNRFFYALLVSVVFLSIPLDVWSCEHDNDCPGDEICEGGHCVLSDESTEASGSTQASHEDASLKESQNEEVTPNVVDSDSINVEGHHTHDGFYLNLYGGLGFVHFESNDEMKSNGAGWAFNGRLGYAVAEDWILYIEGLLGQSWDLLSKTTVEDDENLGIEGGQVNDGWDSLEVFHFLLGGGLACYAFDSNVYISATAGVAWNRPQWNRYNSMGLSKPGFGMSFMLAREWWKSDNWGVGAALQLVIDAADPPNYDGLWSTVSVTAGLSATYN